MLFSYRKVIYWCSNLIAADDGCLCCKRLPLPDNHNLASQTTAHNSIGVCRSADIWGFLKRTSAEMPTFGWFLSDCLPHVLVIGAASGRWFVYASGIICKFEQNLHTFEPTSSNHLQIVTEAGCHDGRRNLYFGSNVCILADVYIWNARTSAFWQTNVVRKHIVCPASGCVKV